jgi:hypothetical protein
MNFEFSALDLISRALDGVLAGSISSEVRCLSFLPALGEPEPRLWPPACLCG